MSYLFYIINKKDKSVGGVTSLALSMEGDDVLVYKIVYPPEKVNNIALHISASVVFEDKTGDYDYRKHINLSRLLK